MVGKTAPLEDSAAKRGPAWTQQLIGHDACEAAIARTLDTGRIPHAWMIAGPKGVGKATLAYRLARRLLTRSQQPTAEAALFGAQPMTRTITPTLDVDPNDPIRNQVAKQTHPDFRLLEPKLNPKTGKRRHEIVIDDVREAIEFLRLKPALGVRRVVIVDSADELNRNAANALLKILEEPPADAVLLLIAHAPRALLPTIVSRCRRVTLRPLSDELVAEALQRQLPRLKPDECRLACALAEGSLGRAIRLAEEGGGPLFEAIAANLQDWPAVSPKRLHDIAERLAGRTGAEAFALAREILGWWMSRFLRLTAKKQHPVPDLFESETALIKRMAAAHPPQRWLERWERADEILGRVQRVNMDKKQAWIVANLILLGQVE